MAEQSNRADRLAARDQRHEQDRADTLDIDQRADIGAASAVEFAVRHVDEVDDAALMDRLRDIGDPRIHGNLVRAIQLDRAVLGLMLRSKRLIMILCTAQDQTRHRGFAEAPRILEDRVEDRFLVIARSGDDLQYLPRSCLPFECGGMLE